MAQLHITVTGVDHLSRPMWPETENGALYKRALIQYMTDSPGYVGRTYPQYNIVVSTFDTGANLKAFLAANKDFLAEFHSTAKAYYEMDGGCSIEILIQVDQEPDITITDVGNPNAYILN